MAKVCIHYLIPQTSGRVLSALNSGLNNGQPGEFQTKGAACDPTIPLPPANFGPTQQPWGFTGEVTAVSCEKCMKTPAFRKDYLLQTGVDLDAQEAAQQTQENAPPSQPDPTET